MVPECMELSSAQPPSSDRLDCAEDLHLYWGAHRYSSEPALTHHQTDVSGSVLMISSSCSRVSLGKDSPPPELKPHKGGVPCVKRRASHTVGLQ